MNNGKLFIFFLSKMGNEISFLKNCLRKGQCTSGIKMFYVGTLVMVGFPSPSRKKELTKISDKATFIWSKDHIYRGVKYNIIGRIGGHQLTSTPCLSHWLATCLNNLLNYLLTPRSKSQTRSTTKTTN